MTDNPTIKPRRLGIIMQPDPANPNEAMGVLNPAATRGRDGQLYLFPRIVAAGNYSRIARARVLFDDAGNPCGVERMGCVLEPSHDYERHQETGGCEDPRITLFKPLDTYVMTYSAWGPTGPRVAIAWSDDLEQWHRTGRVDFIPEPNPVYSISFDGYQNKDGLIFPEPIPDPYGRPSMALLHRPIYGLVPGSTHDLPPGVDDPRASIWISYCPLEELNGRLRGRVRFYDHTLLMEPKADWEDMRIGGGPPPIRTPRGWLLIYHGVSDILTHMLPDDEPREMERAAALGPVPVENKNLSYRVGFALLDLDDPRRVLYRSPEPILEPAGDEETMGVVSNVVFPTGLDVRSDIGKPNRADLYFGAADTRTGVASIEIPS